MIRIRKFCSVSYLLIATCFLFTGCKVGPDYHKPSVDIPNAWREVKPVTPHAGDDKKTNDKKTEEAKPAELDRNALAELEWWKQWNDPALDGLVEKGLLQNFDLKIANTRIREARAELAAARSALLPQVNMTGQAEREGNTVAFGTTTFSKPFNVFQTGFDASWELDLFGKNRRELESFSALFKGAQATRDQVRVSLLAEIARNYINIRAYQAQSTLATQIVTEEENNLKIREELFKAGSTNETDVINARTSEMQAKSQALYYQGLLAASEYALDVLLGENPGYAHTALAEIKPVPVADKEIILAAPAQVIENRPDVRTAERDLASSTARVGVAKSELFPDVSIGGFFGLLNPLAKNLLTANSKSWSMNAALNWPILNYNRISADISLAKAQREEALLSYKKSILAALADVETAVSSYNKQEETRQLMDKTVSENSHALDLANMRYKSGVVSLADVLSAQKNLYLAQSQQAMAASASAQDFIAVYKSLGGGWKNKSADTQASKK